MSELIKQDKRSLGGVRAYFIRGHGGWLLYAIWLLVNISILYVVLGSELPIIQSMFGNIVTFGVIFVISYITLATIIGYVDIELKGIYGQETGVYWDAVPQVKKILELLNHLVDMILDIQTKIDVLEKRIEDMSKKKTLEEV